MFNEAEDSLSKQVKQGAAMEKVAMKYGMEFLGAELFKEFKESKMTGSDFVDTLPMDVLIKRIDEMRRSGEILRDIYTEILKNSRTGIDPGALCLFPQERATATSLKIIKNDITGGFLTPIVFKDEYLSKTGLILVPKTAEPTALAHEYSHFEDEIFYKTERDRMAINLKEVAAYLSEMAILDSFYAKNMPEMSREEINNAEYKYLDEIAKVGKRIGENKTAQYSWMEERKVDKNTKKAFQTAKKLHQNGLSWEEIKTIAMQSKKFEDFLQWRGVSQKNTDELKNKTL